MSEQAASTPKRGTAGSAPAPESLSASQRARRQRIVRAALELLEASAYDKVQMRDVAEAADVALGTVYRYFSSKERLFAAVLLEWVGPFGPRVRRTPKGDDDAARLIAALHRALAAFEQRPQYFKLITVLEVATDPVVAEMYAEFRASTQGVFAEALQDVPDEDVPAVVHLSGAVLDSTLRARSLGRTTLEQAEERLRRAVELVFSDPPVRRT